MKNSILFLTLLITVSSFSQKILVPYKIDNNYALADFQGNLLSGAIYSSLEINLTQNELLNFEKDSVKGLILNGKEIIIDSKYSYYRVLNDSLIIAFNNSENITNKINRFSLKGTKILDEDYNRTEVLKIQKNKDSDDEYICIHGMKYVQNLTDSNYYENFLHDIVIFNKTKDKTKAPLFYNAYKILNYYDEFDSYYKQFSGFLVKRKKEDEFQLYRIKLIDNKIELVNETELEKNSTNFKNQIKSNKYFDEDIDVPFEIIGDYRNHKNKTQQSKIKLKNKSYYFYKKLKGQKEDSILIKLPKRAKNFKLIENKMVLADINLNHEISNYLIYEDKGKIGYYFTDLIHFKPVDYETLTPIEFGKYTSVYQKFIFSKKIKNQKKLKYGIIDILGNIFINANYDSITADYHVNKSNKKSIFKKVQNEYVKVYNNSKFGIIDITGNLISDIKYDAVQINKPLNKNHFSDYSILEFNKSYSVLTSFNIFNGEKISINFKYKPRFMIPNFHTNENILFGLYNDHDEFMGYSNQNGVYFFKD